MEALESYLGPRSSAGHSLRFRDSALAGSDGFSPTPLILNAYQRLESKGKQTDKGSWTHGILYSTRFCENRTCRWAYQCGHLHKKKKNMRAHTQLFARGTGWSTQPGEMSENGAEKEIQSFLSDGAALPREAEMRARHFAHSTRLRAQPCTKKNPFVTRKTKQSQLTVGWSGFTITTCVCVYRVPLTCISCWDWLQSVRAGLIISSALSEAELLRVQFQWVRIYVVTVWRYPKWQAGWGLFLLPTSHILLSWVSLVKTPLAYNMNLHGVLRF